MRTCVITKDDDKTIQKCTCVCDLDVSCFVLFLRVSIRSPLSHDDGDLKEYNVTMYMQIRSGNTLSAEHNIGLFVE